jgi:DNA-binding transcriptional LysR family regulator
LRVNMDPFFSRLVLGPRLGSFIDKHADLQLELITRDQLGDMVADGFDLAIRFGDPPVSTLIARKLIDTRILTVAAPSYLRKHGHPASPAELEGGKHVCIKFRDPLTGYPFSWEFHRGRKKIVITPQGSLTVNDVGTLHSVCAAGQGVAQILALGAESLLATGKLVELFPDWGDEVYPLYALYPSRHHPPAKVRAFFEFIVSLTGGSIREPAA